MRILFLGDICGTSNARLRADALRKAGHVVEGFDLRVSPKPIYRGGIASRFHYRTGYLFLQREVFRRLRARFSSAGRFDLAWVNGGELIGGKALSLIQRHCDRVVLYNNDDPTGNRDGTRWLTLRRAISAYDLCAVLREVNVAEYSARGAGQVHRVWMSYDEDAHRPPEPAEIAKELSSEVAFIGTWMPERGPFMAQLVRLGVPLSIWGDHWQKSPEWPALRTAWRGKAVYGRDYARAVAGARICLGLLSKGNRDLHTRRSVEVPFIGGLLCGERTAEHEMLYREGEEAIFWSNATECAQRCHELLGDPVRGERIRLAGMRRIRDLRLGNRDVCTEILDVLNRLPVEERPWHL